MPQKSEWLRSGRSEDRIPMCVRFSAPILTAPVVQAASYSGSFLRLKRPESDYTLPSSTEVKERVKLYVHPPSWPA